MPHVRGRVGEAHRRTVVVVVAPYLSSSEARRVRKCGVNR